MENILLIIIVTVSLTGGSFLNKIGDNMKSWDQSVGTAQNTRLEISVTERNALLEALTNYEWSSTNKYGISNRYLFRVDDHGVIVSSVRLDTKIKSPERYLAETPRGYKLDYPKLNAAVVFWLTENLELAKSVRVRGQVEEIYAMNPETRPEAYDDNIF